MPLYPLIVPGRAGAIQAAKEAGYTLVQRSDRWWVDAVSDAVALACQALLDGFSETAALRRRLKLQVAAELGRRLTSKSPLSRLVAIGGAAIKLLATNSGVRLVNWPADDLARLTRIQSHFARASDLFDAAVALETAIDGAALPGLRALDVSDNAYWPA